MGIPDLSQIGGMPSQQQIQLEMMGSLQAIVRQLDMLIRLECGVLKRSDLKAELQARISQMQGGQSAAPTE